MLHRIFFIYRKRLYILLWLPLFCSVLYWIEHIMSLYSLIFYCCSYNMHLYLPHKCTAYITHIGLVYNFTKKNETKPKTFLKNVFFLVIKKLNQADKKNNYTNTCGLHFIYLLKFNTIKHL